MSVNENLRSYVAKVLNLPLLDRLSELALIFDRCSLRELQDVFPTVVQSVFGVGVGSNGNGLGWGLRATTQQNGQQYFSMLYEFFASSGPFFRLCYRLLNDAIKFEFGLDLLPHKITEMLQTGQYSMFYADLVNIDPFRRQVTSLSLNAFDFYVLHFVTHATVPLHEIHPAAQQIHNEHMTTVYFHLTSNYFFNFLPSSPDGVVLPTDISSTVKVPTQIPIQPLQPKRLPKYLKIPNSTMYSPNNSAQPERSLESPRAHLWRTESVLHFFIDTWLGYDIDEARNLPSSEFIRVVRVLVKHTHAFGNSAYLDQSSMVSLRKLAQPMMKARVYPFVRSLIARWPLDSSMYVVLELWLSYIQPWRYSHEFQSSFANRAALEQRLSLSNRFNGFIVDNLVIYTQIFVQILARFARLDFTSARNAEMLLRLVKVFSQSNLPKKLYQAEELSAGSSNGFDTPQRNHTYMNPNLSAGSCEWNSFYHSEVYTPMFGPEIREEIEQFVRTVCIAHVYVKQEIASLRRHKLEGHKYFSFLRDLYAKIFQQLSPEELKLREIVAIPGMLEWSIQTLAQMFNMELPNVSMDEIERKEPSFGEVNSFLCGKNDEFDISRISPTQMRNNLSNLNATFDPALLPIQMHESKLLVRFLHQVSCHINEMFGEELSEFWNRGDFWGKVSRQILNPPMTAMWFDKPRGVKELCEDHLPPRLCLRPLASYRVLGLLAASLIAGQIMWAAPSFGLISLILLFVAYLLILALIS